MKKNNKLYMFKDRNDYVKKITDDDVINVIGTKGSGKTTSTLKYINDDDYIVINCDRLLELPEDKLVEDKELDKIRDMLKDKYGTITEGKEFINCYNDIVKYIKDKYKLLVGERTAEEIKITIGTVFPGSRNEKMKVRGRDLVTGLPHSITLDSSEIEEALRESVYLIIHAIKGILEQTPPELSADIIDKGIGLTGGGALVDGFSQLLSQELKVPVFIAESPLTCVAEGTGVLLDNLHMLDR